MTSSNLLARWVLDCMNPLHQYHIYTDTPSQHFGAGLRCQEALSWATVLGKPPIKLNSQLSYCALFFFFFKTEKSRQTFRIKQGSRHHLRTQRFWKLCILLSLGSTSEWHQRPAREAITTLVTCLCLSHLNLIISVVTGGAWVVCRVSTSFLQAGSMLKGEVGDIYKCLQCIGSGVKRVVSRQRCE